MALVSVAVLISFIVLSISYEIAQDKRPVIEISTPIDSIMFVGDSQVSYGESMPYGFLKILRREFLLLNSDITVMHATPRDLKSTDVFENFGVRVHSKHPSIIFILIGVDVLLDVNATDDDQGLSAIESCRTDLETIILNMVTGSINHNSNTTIALCTPTLIGDKYDGTNEKDHLLEEFSAVVTEVAKEFQITIIDLRHYILKYLETFNEENLSHSILTYDGIHMNEAGHMLVAAVILQSIGFDNRNLLEDPILDLSLLKNQFNGRKAGSTINNREEIIERENALNERHDSLGIRGQHEEF